MGGATAQQGRSTFSVWLRTGRWPAPPADGVELKFNPWHDPRNGQFTFAPGGPQSLSRVVLSRGRAAAVRADLRERLAGSGAGGVGDAVFRPGIDSPGLLLAGGGARNPRAGRGGNSRAFNDPMTLEQVFPGLRDRPAGAIVALADGVFDFTGPGAQVTAELNRAFAKRIVEDINAIDPDRRSNALEFPSTLEGQKFHIATLRFERAAVLFRKSGDIRPLQVETLRFLQIQTDLAYRRGVERLARGRLLPKPTREMALGNFIDREVRNALRWQYRSVGVDAAGAGPIRVNRRENEVGAESSYRRPDARVGDIAYDVTLAEKTLKTAQIQGFFRTEFRPKQVIIVRPKEVYGRGSYLIIRPEKGI